MGASTEQGAEPRLMARLWARTGGVRNGVRELAFVTVLYVLYTSSRLLASDDAKAAMTRARELLRIEKAVDIDWEHSLNTWFVHHDTIALMGCYFYSTAHYIATLAALVWLYFKGRDAYLPARRALLVGTILALALYLMLPTAPPRFMGYTDVLALHADQGWWGADASAPRGMGDLTNQLAAFPSLHAGWSLWIALYVTRATRNWILRGLAWADAIITALVIIGTGNHWVLDVIVGWMVIVAGVVSVAAFAPVRERPVSVVEEKVA
jgi:membrane-associated phospholipid phosphatase